MNDPIYTYQIFQGEISYPQAKYCYYWIYKNGNFYLQSENFEAEQEARFAAEGHIVLLKKEK